MSHIQIYDKALCCATGVCGPDVDPALPRFAADLAWLKGRGHLVVRFNLAQQPDAYAKHPLVQERLSAEGVDCLPLVLVDGRLMSGGTYPSRDQFAAWTGSAPAAEPVSDSGSCAGGC